MATTITRPAGLPEWVQRGTYVAWDTSDGAVVVRVVWILQWKVIYKYCDGDVWWWEDTVCLTLADRMRGTRPATDTEIDSYARYAGPRTT